MSPSRQVLADRPARRHSTGHAGRPGQDPLADLEHDYRELKTGLGLDHFEGRSWIGWHRHVTLVTSAHLFCTELRLHDPKAAA